MDLVSTTRYCLFLGKGLHYRITVLFSPLLSTALYRTVLANGPDHIPGHRFKREQNPLPGSWTREILRFVLRGAFLEVERVVRVVVL